MLETQSRRKERTLKFSFGLYLAVLCNWISIAYSHICHAQILFYSHTTRQEHLKLQMERGWHTTDLKKRVLKYESMHRVKETSEVFGAYAAEQKVQEIRSRKANQVRERTPGCL
jgi:hypothetical protein